MSAPPWNFLQVLPLIYLMIGIVGFAGKMFVVPVVAPFLSMALIGLPALLLLAVAIIVFINPTEDIGEAIKRGIKAFVFAAIIGTQALFLLFTMLDESHRNPDGTFTTAAQHLPVINSFIGYLDWLWDLAGAYNPNHFSQFWGFTFGIGFFDYIAMLLPLLYFAKTPFLQKRLSSFQGFLLIGFLTGLGYAIARCLTPAYAPWAVSRTLDDLVSDWYRGVPLTSLWGMLSACVLFGLAIRYDKITKLRRFLMLTGATLCLAMLRGIAGFAGTFGEFEGLISMIAVILLLAGAIVWVLRTTRWVAEEVQPPVCSTAGAFVLAVKNRIQANSFAVISLLPIAVLFIWLASLASTDNNIQHYQIIRATFPWTGPTHTRVWYASYFPSARSVVPEGSNGNRPAAPASTNSDGQPGSSASGSGYNAPPVPNNQTNDATLPSYGYRNVPGAGTIRGNGDQARRFRMPQNGLPATNRPGGFTRSQGGFGGNAGGSFGNGGFGGERGGGLGNSGRSGRFRGDANRGFGTSGGDGFGGSAGGNFGNQRSGGFGGN